MSGEVQSTDRLIVQVEVGRGCSLLSASTSSSSSFVKRCPKNLETGIGVNQGVTWQTECCPWQPASEQSPERRWMCYCIKEQLHRWHKCATVKVGEDIRLWTLSQRMFSANHRKLKQKSQTCPTPHKTILYFDIWGEIMLILKGWVGLTMLP